MNRPVQMAMAVLLGVVLAVVVAVLMPPRADAAPHRPGVHKARTCYTLMGERHCTLRWVHRVNRGQR